nr:cell envelope integrity protein TolA [uncultured Pseudomonas sp.]
MQQRERSPSESLFWPVLWAVALHVLMFAMLFVSFAFAPDLPPARPVVQATLYKLQSQSQATTQTNQKIAGEIKKTTAPIYETEQLEQKKAEQEKQAVAAKAAEQKKAEEAKKAEAAKKADAEKKAAEQKKLADIAKKKAADEAAKKKAAEDAKKKAAEEAKKKAAAEAAKKKAAEDAKKKAAEAAQRKALEDKKAAALAELLSEDVGRQQAMAETQGDEVAGNLDDLITRLITESWQKPMSARPGMSVQLQIQMLPDGTITNVSVTRSSGDGAFDSSSVAAVRNVGRIPQMQDLDRATFDRLYRQRDIIFQPRE